MKTACGCHVRPAWKAVPGLLTLAAALFVVVVVMAAPAIAQAVPAPVPVPETKRDGVKASAASSLDVLARQVTVFAIRATPDTATVDPRLSTTIRAQLRKILPDHGFKLLDVQSKRIDVDQKIVCSLARDYTAETTLVRPQDENGKVQLRCTLMLKKDEQFSTLVKTPVNQLFFYEGSLKDGSRVLIGVGAR